MKERITRRSLMISAASAGAGLVSGMPSMAGIQQGREIKALVWMSWPLGHVLTGENGERIDWLTERTEHPAPRDLETGSLVYGESGPTNRIERVIRIAPRNSDDARTARSQARLRALNGASWHEAKVLCHRSGRVAAFTSAYGLLCSSKHDMLHVLHRDNVTQASLRLGESWNGVQVFQLKYGNEQKCWANVFLDER
jgi:hypothetical protein